MKNVFTIKQRLGRLAYTAGLLFLVLAGALSLSTRGILAADLNGGTAPDLGVADTFAALGGSTLTNTGDTIINGDLGVWPGDSITGFPPGLVNEYTYHIGDSVAQQAQSDVTAAYINLAAQPCDENLSGQDLGGKTLTPGVYCFDSSAQLTGTLTLDGKGDEWSVFVFKIGSTLTTASGSSVNIINADRLCNVFWQVTSSATLGTTTAFKGNILALQSITLNTNAAIIGKALARNGALTLDTNTITMPVCAVQPTSQPTATTEATTAATEATTAPTSETTTGTTASTPQPETLPDTGGDLAGPGSQMIRLSLAAVGLTLILFGVLLSRRTHQAER